MRPFVFKSLHFLVPTGILERCKPKLKPRCMGWTEQKAEQLVRNKGPSVEMVEILKQF